MTHTSATGPAVTALLERVVDYAGLFPPAGLSMLPALRAFAGYRQTAEAWMLGRFVVPAGRLGEFDDAGHAVLPTSAAESWALSAILSDDVARDVGSIRQFNERHRDARGGAVHVDTVELKASYPGDVEAAGAHVAGFDAFVEIPVVDDPEPLVAAIAGIGAKAKVRTGGLTAAAIPAESDVVRFMRRCLDRGVPFKATAGLHHALRAVYPLTYERDAPRGTMFGFLNVLLAAAVMRQGGDDETARTLLVERDPSAIRAEADRIQWRDVHFTADALRTARHGLVAVGSCSFREPVDDLREIGIL